MKKAQMRAQLKDRLQSLTAEQRRHKSDRACQRLVATSDFLGASTVMMFLSFSEEIDTALALEAAWLAGKTVVVPKIIWQDRHMEAVIVTSWEDEFNVCPRGLRCPTQTRAVSIDSIDLVVTPGLGFDEQGRRLGRGGAFYDRFFKQEELRAVRCGFAFEEQILDAVPTAAHDQPVDCVITDERVIRPGHPTRKVS
jgi:5-formyltetrahydrofolate cyclo-ligase